MRDTGRRTRRHNALTGTVCAYFSMLNGNGIELAETGKEDTAIGKAFKFIWLYLEKENG